MQQIFIHHHIENNNALILWQADWIGRNIGWINVAFKVCRTTYLSVCRKFMAVY